jgi:hypothetical protein
MYFLHVGVLKSLQNGNLSSRTPTFEKNVMTASINFWVSDVDDETCASMQPSRTSNATRAMAASQRNKSKDSYIHPKVTQKVFEGKRVKHFTDFHLLVVHC